MGGQGAGGDVGICGNQEGKPHEAEKKLAWWKGAGLLLLLELLLG